MKRWLGALCLLGCGTRAEVTLPPEAPAAKGHITLVESVPAGAMDDDPAIPDTDEVWRAMIAGAAHDVALEQFYVSPKPPEQHSKDRLQALLGARAEARARGVRVRLVADKIFALKYPDALMRLGDHGIVVRLLDADKYLGGVQHAK